jgi:hypothetical protein
MNNPMRFILTTIILTMLAQPVWAQSVYYCVMTNLYSIEGAKLKEYEPERFIMMVGKKQVNFSKGYMSAIVLEVVTAYQDSSFSAKFDLAEGTPYAIARYEPPHFRYSVVSSKDIVSVQATCEEF